MNDNTRVLACQIDEELQKMMKEYVTKQNITVKNYVTGLIREDLEKHTVQEDAKTNLNEQQLEGNKLLEESKGQETNINKNDEPLKQLEEEKQNAIKKKSDLKVLGKDTKKQTIEKNKEEDLRTQIIEKEIKDYKKKQQTKKKQKEEKEEFE